MLKIRGRPRGFDLQDAIQTVQAIFWKHGFDATSLADLASAVGVHKPSLYAAYGGKRELYLAAYAAYQSEAGMLVNRALSHEDFSHALREFFSADLDLFLADGGRGCFMFATAVPLARNNPEIAKLVSDGISGLTGAISARVSEAKKQGYLSSSLDPATATDLIISAHIAIADRCRSGEQRANLEEMVHRLISHVCQRSS